MYKVELTLSAKNRQAFWLILCQMYCPMNKMCCQSRDDTVPVSGYARVCPRRDRARSAQGRLPQHGRCGDGPLGFGRQEEYGVNSKKSGLAIALAALTPIVILAIWSFAFSRTHAAGAAFLALYFILGFGAYRSILLRCRAIRTAFFVNGSFLHRRLQARLCTLSREAKRV